MTTRIHVVNMGPDLVEITPTNCPTYVLSMGESQNEYVYEGRDVVVVERKPAPLEVK
jgi:hypothetical protein